MAGKRKSSPTKPTSTKQEKVIKKPMQEKAITKPKQKNPKKYDGFAAPSLHLFVDLGTAAHLVLDGTFLANLVLPRLVRFESKKKKKPGYSLAGVSQFKAQFETPEDWFKKFRTVNPTTVLNSRAQYATVWEYAVDCAVRSGHIDSLGLDAAQQELETQQMRGLLNHSKFRFITRAEEISKLEGLLEQKKKGSVPFRGIQDQIKALKKPMKIDHSSNLRLMRNKHDITDPGDFKMYPSSKRTTRKKAMDEEKTRVALLSNVPRVPNHHIEEPPLHNGIRRADESSAPQLIKGCGPQRSGDNMIPLSFNRLQHRNNHPIGNMPEVAPRQNVSLYEMNLAGRQTFPNPYTSNLKDEPFSFEPMDYQGSRQRLWSDVDRLISKFAPDRYMSEADSGSVNNSVFSSAYAASMSPFTSSDNNQNGDVSSHGLPLEYDEDFNGYTGLPESIDSHYRYYGLNMQINAEHEAFMKESYKSGSPSTEAEDEDSDMMETDSSDVSLCVGLPPPEKDTKVSGIVALHDVRYSELFGLGSYPGGGLADGLPRGADDYYLYSNTGTEAAYPFHSGPNPLTRMSGYERLGSLASGSSDRLPKSTLDSWSATHGDLMSDAMVEQKQPLPIVKPEWMYD